MRILFLALLLIGHGAAQGRRFDRFSRDLNRVRAELGIARVRAVIVESGRVVWRNAPLHLAAPDEPVIAAEIQQLVARGRLSLDDPIAKYNPGAQVPRGATIRQILSHTADGTPGEEFLYNPVWFDALKPLVANQPVDAVKFARELDTTRYGLGWFIQTYSGMRLVWSFSPSCLFLNLPDRKLTLIVWADSKILTDEPRLAEGNIVRSAVALAFLKDVALSSDFERDELENRALAALYLGRPDQATAALRQALARFPELESTNDPTLLYLLSQLHFRETEACATVVIEHHPYLPTAWFYYGMFLENDKRYREAAACFNRIVDHQPPWHHWTVAAAKKELAGLQ